MKNKNLQKKLLTSIAFMVLILFVTTAVTCNFCGTPVSVGEETSVSVSTDESPGFKTATGTDDTNAGSADESYIESTEEDPEDSDDNEEQVQGEPEAPEISIFIIDGPTYSPEDDVCYYRIGSEVYGNPYPKISWSKDDSNRAFGEDVAQVNLRRGETYTLTATASNSLGSETSKITLTWGCDGQDVQDEQDGQDGQAQDDPDQEQQQNPGEVDTLQAALFQESGCVSQDRTDTRTDMVIVGHWENNKDYRGYLSFNLVGYDMMSVKDAKLVITLTQVYTPITLLGELRLGVIDYGAAALDSRVVGLSSAKIGSFPGYSGGMIELSSENLADKIEEKIDAHKSRIQFTYYWSTPEGYADTTKHCITFKVTDAKLYMTLLK